MDKKNRSGMLDRCAVDVSDKDIYEAMKDIPGYLDVTPGDLKEIYLHAYQHAVERLTRSIKARDFMTKKVIFAGPDAPLHQVARMMAEHGISGVPVIDNDRVVGIISEKDFLSHLGGKGVKTFMGLVAECLAEATCSTGSLQTKSAREIMSSPVVSVEEDTPLADVADLFTSRRINRVPVLDKQGRMVGIVTRDDLVKASFGGM